MEIRLLVYLGITPVEELGQDMSRQRAEQGHGVQDIVQRQVVQGRARAAGRGVFGLATGRDGRTYIRYNYGTQGWEDQDGRAWGGN